MALCLAALFAVATATSAAAIAAVAGAEPPLNARVQRFSLSRLGVNGLFRADDLQSAAFPTNESFVLSWRAAAEEVFTAAAAAVEKAPASAATTSAAAEEATAEFRGGGRSPTAVGDSGLRVVAFEVTVSERFVPRSSVALREAASSTLPPSSIPTASRYSEHSAALLPWSSGVVLAGNDPFFVIPENVSVLFPEGASLRWTVQLFCDSALDNVRQKHGANRRRGSSKAPAPCSGVEEGLFETAPPDQWWAGADWLGGGSELRADWTLPLAAQIVHARAYVAGVGAFDLHVNGAKASDHVMDPGESVFDVKTLFVTYNITEALVSKSNELQELQDEGTVSHAVGVRLGNSKWGYLDIYTNRTDAEDQSGDSTRAFRMVAVA